MVPEKHKPSYEGHTDTDSTIYKQRYPHVNPVVVGVVGVVRVVGVVGMVGIVGVIGVVEVVGIIGRILYEEKYNEGRAGKRAILHI